MVIPRGQNDENLRNCVKLAPILRLVPQYNTTNPPPPLVALEQTWRHTSTLMSSASDKLRNLKMGQAYNIWARQDCECGGVKVALLSHTASLYHLFIWECSHP